MRIALKANELYVCAELGGGINYENGHALVANRPDQNIWEEFNEIPQPDGKFALQTYSGNYVTAEDVGFGVSTDRTVIGPWELFKYVGQEIQTNFGTYLYAPASSPIIQAVHGTAFERIPLEIEVPVNTRKGLVRAEGRCAIDDDGLFHPLGLTFFWALYGWKYERDKVLQHLEWLKQFGYDYLRILGEVNWSGRSIDYTWPDYQEVLAGFTDAAYEHGLRIEMTLIGGKPADPMLLSKKVTEVLNDGRQHKVAHYEVANEYGRLDKISPENLVKVGKYLVQNTPNLVSLSAPDDSYSSMIEMTEDAGVNMYTPHTHRADHDNYWAAVRQGYDLRLFPSITSNNEPQGVQSSVESFPDAPSTPMQLAMARATGIVCSGAFYVLHVGQGVTGTIDTNHNRPENMWEVPNIDNIMQHVRRIDEALPQGIENWRVANNARDWHPLPLDPRIGVGFWEGNKPGSVNKNYATVDGNRFVECLNGVKNPDEEGMTLCGNAKNDSHIVAWDVNDYSTKVNDISSGKQLYLRGRKDTMIGYVLQGNL